MNVEITNSMLNDFYECFRTGYEFEFFLKRFLEDLGFTDIKVTKRSGDKGIDLIAYKSSILSLDIDPEKYIIQAKRYKNTVPVKEIREFKGTSSYEKRIFITTSAFTGSGIEEAENDSFRKIILINGEQILRFYIEHPERDYIFDWNPVVSAKKVRNTIKDNSDKRYDKEEFKKNCIIRLISNNDIRARILPIPAEIFEKVKKYKSYNVEIEGKQKKLNINHERRYFGGVTEIYKDAGYYDYKGENKKESYWKIDENENKIIIEFE
ncbi:MAG: restriction endonuclease [Clostridia bacterium]|nr:restriction endonuclease [Clostridia bacterium]